jgi:diguanylate cyclase (GGDEF)-like protein
VQQLALSDPLTHLANSRAFFERLEAEVDRAARYGTIFTVAYLDLDRFKEVNDTLGHAEGDEVLKTVADILRRTTRSSDVTARLGGDEFGVLLPETPYGRAEGALTKLRAEILAAMATAGWPVTASVGAVTFEAATSSADQALKMADSLMYEVKEDGADGIRHMLWTGEPDAS